MDVYQKSLALHKEHRGKIELKNKVPLDTADDLALAYTPGVAEACREIAKNPKLVNELTLTGNTVAVVSDGSAVLGLGNIGPRAAMPVMEGKAALFKEFADVDAFPIVLDTQDIEEIIATVRMIAPTFAGINLEDIAAPRCFEIEERLQRELDIPVLHDDQNGTAIVVLAGLINAIKVRGISVQDARLVINGAGAAGTAIIKLLRAHGFKNMTVIGSTGVLSERNTCGVDGKNHLCGLVSEVCSIEDGKYCSAERLEDAIVGADIFIGVSVGGVLTQEMVRSMAERPIIFAMANPVPEIMPNEALEAGAFIVATGRSDFPNQINNVIAFPGLFRGAIDAGIKQFTQEMFLAAAHALAERVENPTAENIIPNALDRENAQAVARAIAQCVKYTI